MKLETVLFLVITILIFNFSVAQEKPDKASQIFNKALELAKKENKNVFIMFHAS